MSDEYRAVETKSPRVLRMVERCVPEPGTRRYRCQEAIAKRDHNERLSTPIFIEAAVLLGMSLAGPRSAWADVPQHHDQVPGFHRLDVGDLEVTSLYDGGGQFEPRWLNGQKRIMTAVANTVQKEPHFLDGAESGFLVNTGKQVILVDAGAGQWWGGGALGRLETSLRSAGYTPEQVDLDDRQRTANLNDDARHIVRRKRRQSWASTRARSRS